MYLVKIPRSASMDVSIYHEKYKAPFKNINITKSLRCKLKVAGVYFHQKIVFWVLFVLLVLRSYMFFINNFHVMVNVVVKAEELRTISKEISGN